MLMGDQAFVVDPAPLKISEEWFEPFWMLIEDC
jgi:hypothetical protein